MSTSGLGMSERQWVTVMACGCPVPMRSLEAPVLSVWPSHSHVAQQTVNLPAQPTLVRTQHLPPIRKWPLTRTIARPMVLGAQEQRSSKAGSCPSAVALRLEPADSTATHGVARVWRTASVDDVRYGSQ